MISIKFIPQEILFALCNALIKMQLNFYYKTDFIQFYIQNMQSTVFVLFMNSEFAIYIFCSFINSKFELFYSIVTAVLCCVLIVV